MLRSIFLAFSSLTAVHAALLYRGVDWSSVKVEEDNGISYKTASGNTQPLEKILASNGVNIVRQRIWTGNEYNVDYNLDLARRAKAAGLDVYLNLHYSDTWADPGHQAIPRGWPTDIDNLSWRLYNYTLDVSNRFASAGITPKIISIGNEIRAGMLFPTGSYNNPWNLARLLHSAAWGVKDSNLGTQPKIMIHLDNGWNWDTQKWWYDLVLKQGPLTLDDFDVMGVSYYPFYNSGARLSSLKSSLTNMANTWGKELIVAETDWPTQCSRPAYEFPSDLKSIPFSAAGQTTFIQQVASVVSSVPKGTGLFYWEPAWMNNQALGSSCDRPEIGRKMPGIYLSDPMATETTSTSTPQTLASPDEAAITSIGFPGFQLGISTCGFTSSSTITCSFGSECTDVGSYRGCCVAGAADCVSTIYTTCLGYEDAVVYGGNCGSHTLCCPAATPSCFSYFVLSTAEDRPDATLTHVECHESAGYGEMFPYPPELTTKTTAYSSPAKTSDAEPTDDSDSSSPTGAIVGAALGVVALLCLAGRAAFLIVRQRRRRRHRLRQRAELEITAAAAALPPRDRDGDGHNRGAAALGGTTGRNLRPLSTIHEQLSPGLGGGMTGTAAASSPLTPNTPSSSSSSSREKRKSAGRGYGPQWPLGSGNPLAAHPVNLEERLSDPRNSIGSAPQIQLPPPPPGPRLAPLPPPPKSQRTPSSSQPHTPTSISAGLQSPRLSYVPVSPIDAAFRDDAEATTTARPEDFEGSGSGAATGLAAVGVAIGRGPSTRSARASLSRGVVSIPQQHQQKHQHQHHEPVSPMGTDDGDDAGGSKRLSFVSIPSVRGDGDPDLVSPVSPEDRLLSSDGGVSPATVSPIESRRGSLVDR
ncbi:hypothetical protein DL764_008352 [Monosporascus ibericus]|uniref:Arabinogalactan endo-beta-1,4-galactanase n=1 Tax=Monosporascus ibericus TaxID=155417 RepID=A0A4V1X9A3_9PEZI|nr:hypothetical protein DL764_008352 [Monosporascus ibericus]